MKKLIILCIAFGLFSCAELQQVVNTLPQDSGGITNVDIANGLRQALDNGIDKQVAKLTQTDGFYRNELVKIVLPQELQRVDRTLRDIGMGNLADEGLKVLNRAAEDAVKEATPIFVNAVRQITFDDARNILMGPDNAATQYLSNKTTQELYGRFNPVISNSLDKVGATQIWSNIITQYNSLPLTTNVNPDLADYVTQEALKGVFNMIAVEEKEIRNNFAARTSDILRRVFALQDGR